MLELMKTQMQMLAVHKFLSTNRNIGNRNYHISFQVTEIKLYLEYMFMRICKRCGNRASQSAIARRVRRLV